MSESTILLGSENFKKRLENVAATAKDIFLAQAMTFEGDDAGRWLIDTMKSSPAKEKKLLIDSYSKLVINDHFVPSIKYLNDATFKAEVKATCVLVEEAIENGIDVQFTNPVGFLALKYPLRNHKKMVVIDNVSFLGGINFSDHNFEWHDMMVELADQELGKVLTDDFRKTWNGKNQSLSIGTQSGKLYLFSGSKSKELYQTFFEHISEAREEIQVISPYISEPLLSVLRNSANNGVKVTIISPRENNKSIFKNIILAEEKKGYFELRDYPGMSHMKAVMVDSEQLIFGSSNYDLVSYYFEQEVVFVSKDKKLINEFKQKILVDVLDHQEEKTSRFATSKAAFLMDVLKKVGGVASRTILRPY